MIVNIRSKNNQVFKFIRSLGRRKFRDLESAYVVEGKIVVTEALEYAKKPLYLVVADSLAGTADGKHIINIALEKNIKIYRIPDELFVGLSKTEEPQGVLMVLEKQECSWADFANKDQALLIVLDGIQDPGNLGTIIRTAVAINADAVILTKGTVDLYNDKTLRSTMGALFRIKLMQALEHEEIIYNCEKLKLPIVVADAKGNTPYFAWDFTKGMALVIGSESQGPSQALSSYAEAKLAIPMPGQIESLNAGVAAGILMFERIRQKLTK